TISVSNAGSLAIQSVTAGLPTTINLNGGPLNLSASSVTVGDSVMLVGDNNLTITTPQLNLGGASMVRTTGASVSGFPWIYVTSPAGSGLTVQLPSGSTAILQTDRYPGGCGSGSLPGCNTQTLAGLIKQGGIEFVPFSGQTLEFKNSGAAPTTLQSNGLLL